MTPVQRILTTKFHKLILLNFNS